MQEWLKKVTQNVLTKEVDKKWEAFENINNVTEYIDTYYGALNYCKRNNKLELEKLKT